MEQHEYLTVSEVAQRLRVTPEAVQTWCRKGKLKAIRAGRNWRIAPADVDAFTNRQEVAREPKKANGLAAFVSN